MKNVYLCIMIELASHIEYLLMSHDCVVAPGLGAFLVHETSAFYDVESGLFIPPTRTIGFNQAVTLNDGLLAESIARKERISIDAANAKVEAAIASFRKQLDDSSILPIGNLGEMSSAGGTMLFEPSQQSAVDFRYRGLRPLRITPLSSTLVETSADETEQPERPTVLPLALKIAASIIMILVGCGVFMTTGNLIGNRQTNYASLDSGLRSSVETTVHAPIAEARVDTALPMSREIQLNISVPKAEPEVNVTTVASATPGRYLLVVGSFPSMASARKHIGDNISLDVIDMEGRFRVYAASAPTMAEASRLADELRADYPSVWICRR